MPITKGQFSSRCKEMRRALGASSQEKGRPCQMQPVRCLCWPLAAMPAAPLLFVHRAGNGRENTHVFGYLNTYVSHEWL